LEPVLNRKTELKNRINGGAPLKQMPMKSKSTICCNVSVESGLQRKPLLQAEITWKIAGQTSASFFLNKTNGF
jgi:hypothetical protein